MIEFKEYRDVKQLFDNGRGLDEVGNLHHPGEQSCVGPYLHYPQHCFWKAKSSLLQIFKQLPLYSCIRIKSNSLIFENPLSAVTSGRLNSNAVALIIASGSFRLYFCFS
jgi:hypothetical protein